MFEPLEKRELTGIEALTARLRTEHIPFYHQLDHAKLAYIAKFVSTAARRDSEGRSIRGWGPSPLGLSTAFNICRNYLLVLLTASAIRQVRQTVGPRALLHLAELGAGTGLNCLVAGLTDEHAHTYAFERNPRLIQFSRRLFEHFNLTNRVTTIDGDFLKCDMARFPKFDVVVNENIHMGSFQEPLFEAALKIKPHVASHAVMVPEGFAVEYAQRYFAPREQVAKIKLLELPQHLEFWSTAAVEGNGHLFFEMTSGGQHVFRTRLEGERAIDLGDLCLSTLARVQDGAENTAGAPVVNGRRLFFEGRVRIPVTQKRSTPTLLKILLRDEVSYGGHVPGLCDPYWLYHWGT